MTQITISRAVVEQAVEALELYVPKEDYENKPVGNVMDALRAALAEPVQEAVATMTVREDMGADFKFSRPHTLQPGQQFYLCATPPQRPAEPVQEPVYLEVCCDAHPKWMRVNQRQFDEYVAHGWEGRRLYTAPPQRPAEPVAYSEGRTLHWHDGKGVNDAQLYLAPPQRKPLSEDEIFKIENDIPDDVIGDRAWTIWFARAIERAHKIGGEE